MQTKYQLPKNGQSIYEQDLLNTSEGLSNKELSNEYIHALEETLYYSTLRFKLLMLSPFIALLDILTKPKTRNK